MSTDWAWCFENPREAASEIDAIREKCAELERRLAEYDEAAKQGPFTWLYPDVGSMKFKICQTKPRPPLAFPVYALPPNLPALIEQARKEESDRIGKLIHYPECWDTAAYPTLESALAEIHFCSQCYDNRTDAIRARKP